jgi:hypothetical protein
MAENCLIERLILQPVPSLESLVWTSNFPFGVSPDFNPKVISLVESHISIIVGNYPLSIVKK